MKKVIVLALSFIGVSNLVSAQQAAASAADANAAPIKKAKVVHSAGPAAAAPASDLNERKADKVVAAVPQTLAADDELESRKLAITNDNTLTPEQKKKAYDAIDAEKAARLKKSMGSDKYNQMVTEQKAAAPTAKPAKKEKQ